MALTEALRPGLRVEIVGLQGRSEFNGIIGTLEDKDEKLNRWKVRLERNGEKKYIKHCNLRALPEFEDEEKVLEDDMLPELLNPSATAAVIAAEQAATAKRVAVLETQLATMSADIRILWTFIDDLFSRADTPRLNGADVGDSSNLTSFAIRKTGHEASLRRRDKALEDLQSHVGLLQDCLEQLDVLPRWCLQRQRFRAVCQASKWCPSASAVDALKQESVLLLVFGFAEPTDAAALQPVSTVAKSSSIFQKVQAQRILQSACAKAETEPTCLANWSALSSGIEAAMAANVDDKQIQAAMQVCVTGRAKALVEGSASREELLASLSDAQEAGIPQEEITAMQAAAESRLGEQERTAEKGRKLRIALYWVSTANLPKLQKAIAEAEEAGVDAAEIAKAQRELSRLQDAAYIDDKQACLPQEEITTMRPAAESRMGVREPTSDQHRRLRIALSWASIATLPKLRKAITEAEEAGVDAEEIAEAQRVVSKLDAEEKAKAQREVERLQAESAGLIELLHVAKPAWDATAANAALQKLACVGIATTRQLESALDTNSADNSLNRLLEKAELRTFTEDTCKSMRAALRAASTISTSAAPPPSAAPGATGPGGSARWRASKTAPPPARRGASTTTWKVEDGAPHKKHGAAEEVAPGSHDVE